MGVGGRTTPASALLGKHFSVHSRELSARARLGTGEKGQGQVRPQLSLLCKVLGPSHLSQQTAPKPDHSLRPKLPLVKHRGEMPVAQACSAD